MTFHSTVLARLAVGLSFFLASVCSAQTVALTFSDGADAERQVDAAVVNIRLLEGLKKYGIQAALFPSLKYGGYRFGLNMASDWGKAGHMVGNHTLGHLNLSDSKVPWNIFVRDVEEASYPLSKVPGYVRMLRFPYLKEGDSWSKIDGVRRWMKAAGYRNAPVSIDISDWYYGLLYDKHMYDPAFKKEKFRKYYVAHMLARASYYDGLARKVLKRSPPHILSLHRNRLNADVLPAIVEGFRSKGWRFVPASKAYADPLYAQQVDLVPAGESIIWQLAWAKKVAGLRYPPEDRAYEARGLKAAGLLPKDGATIRRP